MHRSLGLRALSARLLDAAAVIERQGRSFPAFCFPVFLRWSPFFIRLMDSCTMRQLFPRPDYALWPLFYLQAWRTSNERIVFAGGARKERQRRGLTKICLVLSHATSAFPLNPTYCTHSRLRHTNYTRCQNTHMEPKMSQRSFSSVIGHMTHTQTNTMEPQ